MIGALSLLLVGAICAFLYFLIEANARREPRDKDTLCLESGVLTAQVLVLLDTTDAIAPVTKTVLGLKLDDLVASVPKNALLDIRVLNEDPSQTRSVLSLCNPGDGSDIDPITGAPEMAKRRWQNDYRERVRAELDEAIEGTEQNFSPILEAIQSIAAERLSSAAQQKVPTTIVVISDMLEHTERYSHFRDGLDFATYLDKVGQRFNTDLSGAEIAFWMVQRDRPDIDPIKIVRFWEEWADKSNGYPRVSRLTGMGP